MPYFQPHEDNRNELYLGNPSEQKGIHCRFGMKGVIAENHFDAGRNSIALLGGRRRYILSHPKQCKNLALFPHGHESARHSEVDYANPDLSKYPEFAHDALANEVVLEAGQVLYLPVYWFHFIVSLEINYQCNTRSGNTDNYNSEIQNCGFPVGGTIKHHHHH
jgi:ribosomal protein L16 Arg81 hydroxylase